ncbi:D-methionine-binding lipoprotein metQ precursor [Bacteroidales bacterium Barb7]|nr:D-methionine-binding lipoprotein metQ precursor [Bacteroidales bacterium Barb4]OAV69839.1 D-methionine-binding lipoprotein metQ precursor [Bacteroidales bacterium Barb6XT]OAV72721.1 D-methionine-binding lipoprotein metQ precursor [Bacteroidales bacterium Barb7]
MKSLLSILLAGLLAVSCGTPVKNSSDSIKVGVESGPEYVVAQAAQKVAREQFGLEVELVQFNDYIMPNTALHQKDIDVNVYQTRPFLEEQSRQRGYKFVILGNTFVYPIAAYSRKIKTVEELKDGSTIIIPNDITNGGRSLLLLAKAGLITLREDVGYYPRMTDVTGNPHNLNILELEAPQLPRALDDNNVDLAVINNSFAVKAGLFLTDGIIVEDKDSPYVNIIVAREDNSNDERVRKFVQAYQSEEVLRTARQEFKDGAIQGW